MKKKIGIVILLIAVIAIVIAYPYYKAIYSPNKEFDADTKELLIPTGSSMDDLLSIIKNEGILEDTEWFEKVASWKKFTVVKPGRYIVENGMSNQELINMLRIGDQKPVKVTFNSARVLSDIAGKISAKLELDSLDVLYAIENKDLPGKYGFNSETYRTLFIPNTYEVYWNISADDLIERLAKEYKNFWSDDRKAKAKKIGLSQSEVTILASIVNAETAKTDEAGTVAGLYMNRINRGMALESDPTLIYAKGDFTIKRVLNEDKLVNSPYNTYMHRGLPPGPINIPSPTYIDAVLNYKKHDYIFMCAKADFSGYHNFSKTNRQHEIYAAEYRKALNDQRTYR